MIQKLVFAQKLAFPPTLKNPTVQQFQVNYFLGNSCDKKSALFILGDQYRPVSEHLGLLTLGTD